MSEITVFTNAVMQGISTYTGGTLVARRITDVIGHSTLYEGGNNHYQTTIPELFIEFDGVETDRYGEKYINNTGNTIYYSSDLRGLKWKEFIAPGYIYSPHIPLQ